jgi:hypothetical protein
MIRTPMRYLAVCQDRFVLMGSRMGRCALRAMGPVLIIMAILLISLCVVIYLWVLLPSYRPLPGSPMGELIWWMFSTLSLLMIANIYFNYIWAVRTSCYSRDLVRTDASLTMVMCILSNSPRVTSFDRPARNLT